MPQLVNLSWNSTNACNLKCKHCYASSGDAYTDELTTYEIRKYLIDELEKLNAKFVSISGGEPLMRKDIFNIIEYINDKNIKISMVSNGILINQEVAKRLEKIGVQRLQISLESADEEENDSIRGKGAFESAVKAIKILASTNIYTAVAVTPTYGGKKLEKLIEFSKEIGADVVSIRRFVPMGRGIQLKDQYNQYTREEFLSIINTLQDKYKGIIKINSADPIQSVLSGKADELCSEKLIGGCTAGITSCAVNSLGEIFGCTRMAHSLGNIRTEQLSKVWKSHPDLLRLRSRRLFEGKCSKCKYLNVCGGCRAGAINAGNGLLGEDPECFVEI